MKMQHSKTTRLHPITRTTRHLLSTLLAGCLLGALSVSAQSFSELEATIRNDDSNHDESVDTRVKYSVTSTTARKSYYQFDIPAGVNTNYGLDLQFTSARRQYMTVWGLDQAYPGLDTNIIWSIAQANQTNGALNNDMLTDPTNAFTATPLYDFVSPGGSSFGTWSFHIPAPWGAHVFANKLILVLTGRDDPPEGPNNDSGGFRVAPPLSTLLSYAYITAGTPPSLGAISNLMALSTQPSATNSFTVGDPDDGPAGLAPWAVSSDESVVPSANVFFGGSGANRTVYVVGGANTGTAEITVTVSDNDGNLAERAFQVTVETFDYAPVISIAPTNTLLNTVVDVPFTVEDVETAATNLIVTGFVEDYSTNILASVSISSDPGGTNRTLTVTPVTGATGVGVATINVSDSFGNTTSTSCGVMVLPSADTVFYDEFQYPLSSQIFETSGGLWARRNGSPQNIKLKMSDLAQEVWIRPKNAEDGRARLAGAPYSPGAGAILYTKFKASWAELGDIPVVADSGGAFVMLKDTADATGAWRAGVVTDISGAPLGSFNMAIANSSATNWSITPPDITIPGFGGVTPTYNVVTRYDVDTAVSTLWVDATDETDPSVSTLVDSTLQNINYLNLRQALDMGNIYLDDLTVVLVQKPVLTSIAPPSGGNVEIFFTGGVADTLADFDVVGSATVNGTYNPVANSVTALGGGSFKAMVTGVSGDENYYKVIRTTVVSF